jgi:hypothetical protein
MMETRNAALRTSNRDEIQPRACAARLGNCGAVDLTDIAPFVTALLGPCSRSVPHRFDARRSQA